MISISRLNLMPQAHESSVVPDEEPGWTRRFDAESFPRHEKFAVGVFTALSLAPLGMRMMMHVNSESKLGRASIINPFDDSSLSPGPHGGVPLGGRDTRHRRRRR